jgi:AbrB family looped-hinge helix DNA binding protein
MKTTISAKGQIVLPAALRKKDGIKPGDEFTVERIARGAYRLVHRTRATNEGVIDWLLACPEKGFFVPIRRHR